MAGFHRIEHSTSGCWGHDLVAHPLDVVAVERELREREVVGVRRGQHRRAPARRPRARGPSSPLRLDGREHLGLDVVALDVAIVDALRLDARELRARHGGVALASVRCAPARLGREHLGLDVVALDVAIVDAVGSTPADTSGATWWRYAGLPQGHVWDGPAQTGFSRILPARGSAGPLCRANAGPIAGPIAGPTPGPARRCRAVMPGRCRASSPLPGRLAGAAAGPSWQWPGRCRAVCRAGAGPAARSKRARRGWIC